MDPSVILLVEDHPTTRKLVKGALEHAGFAVREAKDSQSALALMSTERPRLVVQDLQLPDIDPFLLASELRALAKDEVRVLALSGLLSSADARRLEASGFDDVIEKPVDPVRLRARVREQLAPEARAVRPMIAVELGRSISYAAELGVLTSVSTAALTEQDIEQALATALSLAVDACGRSFGALYLRDRHGHLRVRPIGVTSVDSAALAHFFGQEPWLREVIAEGRSVGLEGAPGAVRSVLGDRGFRDALIVPLTHAGAPLGALFLASAPSDRVVENTVLEGYARGIAAQAAQALALMRALSEREQAERAAEQQRRFATEQAAVFRALVEHAPDIVMQLEPSGRVRFVNRAPPGTALESLRTGSWLELARPEYHDAMRAALERVLREGTKVTLETSQTNDRGAVFWTETHLGPIRDGHEVTSVLVVQRDVSAQKQTEAQLLLADRLACVGGLAAGLVHEINNPLASVMANLELGLSEVEQLTLPPHSELIEGLRDACEAAERVRRIVQDLRIFARADETRRGPVDLARLLESVLRLARNEIHYRARLVKRIEHDVPPVVAQEAELGQIFLNLILSGAYAIEEGAGMHRELVVELDRDGPEHVAVTIRHAGDGVPPAARPARPSPFARVPGLGTGLGLALCQRIVTDLGGTISFDDAPIAGARYRVVLPAAPTRVAIRSDVPRALGRARRRGRVLVIDDEPAIVDIVRRTLTRDHDVTTVDRALAALQRIEAGERFDVIFCDLMMPTMSGLDFHRGLARSYPDQADRIVFLTGGAFAADVQRFLEQLPNPCLNKPVDTKQLRDLVDGMIP